MSEESIIETRCRKILEDNGGFIADKARTILLKDPALKNLQSPLEFISKNWRDPLTPAMISLSCEAVGGTPDETNETALALSLIHLSFYIWDDLLDKAKVKSFKPTLLGKFGDGTSLIIGGLVSACAFSILGQAALEEQKRQTVTDLVWNLLVKMAEAETAHLELLKTNRYSSKAKIQKINKEATDLETCLRIGAIIGNGSEIEIRQLGKYGRYLGKILGLSKDFHVTMNLTMELSEKIKSGALPYSLLWAKERSEKVRKKLKIIQGENQVEPSSVKEIVEAVLETNVLSKNRRAIRKFANRGIEELQKVKKNSSTQTLEFFIQAQYDILNDRLSAFRLR